MSAALPNRSPQPSPPHPVLPDPRRPELPEGVQPGGPARWRPWSAFVALIAGFAGAILGATLVGLVAAAFGASLEDPPPAVSIVSTFIQDICLIAAAVVFARMASAPRPPHFGLRRAPLWPSLGWMVLAWIAFFAFTYAFLTAIGADDTREQLPEEFGVDESRMALVAVAILVTVVAPIAEEFFFRGFFFGALRNWRGPWPAAVITGVVFGAIHIGSSKLEFLVPLAFFGIALCALYHWTGSLYPCIALHCINNSIAFGVTQKWDWEIPLLAGGALGALAALAAVVGRTWTQGALPARA